MLIESTNLNHWRDHITWIWNSKSIDLKTIETLVANKFHDLIASKLKHERSTKRYRIQISTTGIRSHTSKQNMIRITNLKNDNQIRIIQSSDEVKKIMAKRRWLTHFQLPPTKNFLAIFLKRWSRGGKAFGVTETTLEIDLVCVEWVMTHAGVTFIYK